MLLYTNLCRFSHLRKILETGIGGTGKDDADGTLKARLQI